MPRLTRLDVAPAEVAFFLHSQLPQLLGEFEGADLLFEFYGLGS